MLNQKTYSKDYKIDKTLSKVDKVKGPRNESFFDMIHYTVMPLIKVLEF